MTTRSEVANRSHQSTYGTVKSSTCNMNASKLQHVIKCPVMFVRTQLRVRRCVWFVERRHVSDFCSLFLFVTV